MQRSWWLAIVLTLVTKGASAQDYETARRLDAVEQAINGYIGTEGLKKEVSDLTRRIGQLDGGGFNRSGDVADLESKVRDLEYRISSLDGRISDVESRLESMELRSYATDPSPPPAVKRPRSIHGLSAVEFEYVQFLYCQNHKCPPGGKPTYEKMHSDTVFWRGQLAAPWIGSKPKQP